MNFIAINPKFFSIINNYTIYKKKFLGLDV